MPLSYKRQGSIKPRGVEKSLVKDRFLLEPEAVLCWDLELKDGETGSTGTLQWKTRDKKRRGRMKRIRMIVMVTEIPIVEVNAGD